MANVTVPYGFELPKGVENVSVALLNRNFTKINDKLKESADKLTDIKSVSAKSTHNGAVFDARQTSLTKITVGTKSFVIAEISMYLKVGFDVPNYTDAAKYAGNIINGGYRPAATVGLIPCIASGAGIGTSLQASIEPNGDIKLRTAGASTSMIIATATVKILAVYAV